MCGKQKPAREKKQAEKDLEERNAELESIMKADWELNTGMARLNLCKKGGRKPIWRWGKKTGKLVRRKDEAGVDWYRYQTRVLIPKLILFAQEYQQQRPGTIVQEENAPSHANFSQETVFSAAKVSRLLWPGNSPDLNMIEPCWAYMKRQVSKKGAPTSRDAAKKACLKRYGRIWSIGEFSVGLSGFLFIFKRLFG